MIDWQRSDTADNNVSPGLFKPELPRRRGRVGVEIASRNVWGLGRERAKRLRQPHRKSTAGALHTGGYDVAPMRPYKSQSKVQTQANSVLRAARIASVKTLKDAWQIIGGDADAGVLNRQYDLRTLLAERNLDLAAGRRVLQRVVEQIRDDALQSLPVTLNKTILRNVGYQADALVLSHRLKQLTGSEHNPGEIDAVEVQPGRT